jgi:GTPase SAR1 family protein
MHIRLLIVGDPGTVKSQFIYRYLDQNNVTISRKIDVSNKINNIGKKKITLQIVNISKKYEHAVSCYVGFVNCVCITYDIANRESFNNVQQWLKIIGPDKNIILIGINSNAPQTVLTSEAETLVQKENILFMEVSDDIQAAFNFIINIVIGMKNHHFSYYKLSISS